MSRVTAEALLGRRIGRTEKGTHQLLFAQDRYGMTLLGLVVAAIECFRQADERTRGADWTADLRTALLVEEDVEFDGALKHAAQNCDLAEDSAENDYQLAPTDEHARRWVAKIDRFVAMLLRLRAGLVKKHRLEEH